MRGVWWRGAALGGMLMLVAAPALADVKSGVDAWQRGEFKKAVAEWRAPALAGDPDAQFNLGQAYKLGRGVDAVDPVLAQSWFLKAAKQGHLQAADNYGIGLYTAGDKAEAAPWLEKSAARGEPRAQLVLATMLFSGDGAPRDPARAYALMTRASQQGLKSASENLVQMDGAIANADRERGIALAQQYAAQQDAQRLAAGGDTRRTAPAEVAMANGDMRRPGVAEAAAPPPAPRRGARRGSVLFPDRHDPAAAEPTAPLERGYALAAPPRAPAPTREAAEPRHPAPKPQASGGRFRVQLGAFRSEANAREQWGRVAGALAGARPSYVKAGAVTRLQAGPFASRAAAAAACRAAKVPCDVLGS